MKTTRTAAFARTVSASWIAAAVLVVPLTACQSSDLGKLESRTASDSGQQIWRPTWGDVATAKVRPGVLIQPGGCTAGFLFVDPLTEIYYMSTAGHCAFSADGGLDGVGSRSEVVGVGEVGTVVFDDGPPNTIDPLDFALIQLDPDVNLIAHPQVVSLQGPTGFMDCSQIKAGDLLAWHGYGRGFRDTGQLQTREGALTRCTNDVFHGVAPAVSGDSGSATLHKDTGMALGLLVGQGGEVAGPMLPFIFRELAKAGFGNVALATVDGGYVSASPTP